MNGARNGSAQGGCRIIGSAAECYPIYVKKHQNAAKESDRMPDRVDWLSRIGHQLQKQLLFLLCSILTLIHQEVEPCLPHRHAIRVVTLGRSWRGVHVLQATDHVGWHSHVHLLGIRQTWQKWRPRTSSWLSSLLSSLDQFYVLVNVDACLISHGMVLVEKLTNGTNQTDNDND